MKGPHSFHRLLAPPGSDTCFSFIEELTRIPIIGLQRAFQKENVDGVWFTCRKCNQWVTICRSCYRGQVYCSKSCSKQARKESQKKSQEKYRKSKKGKVAQSQAQQYFRRKKAPRKILNRDHTTKGCVNESKVCFQDQRCAVCGRPIVEVARREASTSSGFSLRRVWNFPNKKRGE